MKFYFPIIKNVKNYSEIYCCVLKEFDLFNFKIIKIIFIYYNL